MADLDSLNVRISASSKQANQAIDDLVTHLGELNASLNNFTEGSKYAEGLDHLTSGFASLASSINSINLDRVKGLKSAINSLKSISKGLSDVKFGDVSAKSEKAIDQSSEQAKKAAESLASWYNIDDKGVVKQLAEKFDALGKVLNMSGFDSNKSTEEQYQYIQDISDIIQEYARFPQEIDDVTERLAKAHFKMTKGVSDAFDNDPKAFNSFRAKHGLSRTTKNDVDPSIAVSEITGQMPASNDEAVQKIIDATNQYAAAQQNFKQAVQTGETSVEGLNNDIIQLAQSLVTAEPQIKEVGGAISSIGDENEFSSAMSSFDADFLTGLNNISSAAQNTAEQVGNVGQAIQNAVPESTTNGIDQLATSLKSFQGIQIPDFTNLGTLAKAIQSLGSGSAQTAQQNLQTLATGISSLGSVTAQFSGVNFESLNSMVGSIRSLGSKAADSASKNLMFLAEDLQKLANVHIGDMSGLGELVSNIAKLGYSSAQKAVENIPRLAEAFKELIATLRSAGSVNQNVIDLANAMANLASQGAKVSSATHSLVPSLRSFSNGAKSAHKSAFSLASVIGKVYATYWMLFRAMGSIKKAIDISSDLTEVQNVVDTAFGQMSYKVEDFADKAISELGMSELSAKKFASQYQAMGSAMGISGQKVAAASKLVDTSLNSNATGYIRNANSMADMSINLTRLAGDLASFYNVSQDEAAEKLQAVFTGQTRPLREYGLDLTQATLKEWALANGLDADMKSMSQAEKTLLRYQYVMAHTTNAQGDFIKTMDTWANVIRTIQMQFQQLASIIGSAFINAFKPIAIAFRNAMNTVIKLAEKTVNALGKIFGWQIEIQEVGIADQGMQDLADDAGGVADNTDKANKKAKELKRTILGFDELNVLTDNSDKGDSGNGSGATGGGAGGAASDVNGGNVTKITTKPYESNINTLYDLGKKISDTLSDMMEKIDWDSIYKKAENFGKGLAEFLNGLINPRLFYNLGRTIANALNTALHFLDGFGTTFDWTNFGQSIAAGLNGFLWNFDWKLALKDAATFGKGIGDALTSFITAADFYGVGSAVANALNTAITFVLNLGQAIDFKMLGKKIADAINGFFNTFDFKGLAESINTWVQGLYTALTTAIANIDWGSVYEGIRTFLQNLDLKTVAIVIGALEIAKILKATIASNALSTIATSIGGAISSAIAGKLAPMLGIELSKGAGLGTLALAIGKQFGGNFILGVQALFGDGAAAEALATSFGSPFVTFFSGIVPIIGGAAMAIAGFTSQFKDGFSGIQTIIQDVGIALVAVGAVILGAPALVAGVVAGIVAVVATIVVVVKDNWDSVSKIIDSAADYVNGVFEKIVGFFKSMWNGIEATFSGAVNFVKGIIDKIIGFFNSLGEGVDDVIKKITNIIKPFADTIKGITDKIGGFFDGVKNTVGGALDIIQGDTDKKMSSVNKSITDNTDTAQKNSTKSFTQMLKDVATNLLGIDTNTTQKMTSTNKTITDKMSDSSKVANEKLTQISKDTTDKLSEADKTTTDKMTSMNKTVTDNMGESATQASKNLEQMWTDTNTNMTQISDTTSEKMGNVKSSVSENMSSAQQDASSSMDTIKSDAESSFNAVADSASTKFGEAKREISDNISEGQRNVSDGVDSMEDKIKNAHFKFPKIKLPHFKIKGDFDLAKGEVPHLSVDWYANGGFPEDGLFMANHGEMVGKFSNGRTAVANNEQIVQGIAYGVEDAINSVLPDILSRYISKGNDTIIRIGDEDIARAAARGQKKIDKRYNPSIQIG